MADETQTDEDRAISNLSELLKASDETTPDLTKAKPSGGSEDENKDDDYDASYMKRHMKRYMSENKAKMKKALSDMDSLNKAISHEVASIDEEGETAEAMLINGTELVKASYNLAETFASVLKALLPELEYMKELQKAQGTVTLEMAETLQKIGSMPQERKSKTSGAEVDLTKAATVEPGENKLLQKAVDFVSENGVGAIKRKLTKAMEDGDTQAGQALSRFEMAGGDLRRLPQEVVNYIGTMLTTDG